MRKLLLILIVLLMATVSFALTQEEAQQLYYDLGCIATPSQVEGECVAISCSKVQEMTNLYVVEWDVPACVPEWCSAPLIQCTATPIQGVDSCGNVCTKPSTEWPNCIHEDGSIGPIN